MKLESLSKTDDSYNGELMKAGKSGEDSIYSWLINLYGEQNIERLTENSMYFYDDIDFKVINHKRESFLIEVKTDFYITKTKNLAFEYYRLYLLDLKGYEGWGTRSNANKLIIKAGETGKIYVFDFVELREEVRAYLSYEKPKVVSVLSNDKEIVKQFTEIKKDSKITFNILIPLKNLTYKEFTPHNPQGLT